MIKKNIFKPVYLLPLLLNLLFIIILYYQINGYFLQYIDDSTFISSNEAKIEFGYLWEQNNFGNISLVEIVNFFPRVMSYLLLKIGFSTQEMQLVLYFCGLNLIFYSSWISQNLLFQSLKLKKTLISSFLGSFFFSYNLVMTLIWGGGLGESMFIFLASAPVFFYYFYKLSNQKIKTNDIVFLILLLGLNASFIPFNIALIGAIFLSFIIILIYKNNLKLFFKSINKWILLFISSILLGSFSLISLLFIFLYPSKGQISSSSANLIFSQEGVFGIFKLFDFWSISLKRDGVYVFSLFNYFNSEIVQVSVVVIWLIVIYITYKFLKNKKDKETTFLVFSWVIFLLSAFIAKGSQPPFGWLNLVFYKYVPLFSIFRTPDTKFALPMITSFSFLIGYSFSKFKNIFFKGIIILLILIQTLPFFTAKGFLGSSTSQKKVYLPQEYFEIAKIINLNQKQGSLLFYPNKQVDKFKYSMNNQDLLGKLIERPVIYSSNTRITNKSKSLVSDIFNNIDNINIGIYSIRYVFIRKDIIELPGNYYDFTEKISRNTNLIKILETDLGILYEVKNEKKYQNLISLDINDNNLLDYQVLKLNPVHYQIIIKQKESSANLDGIIIFRNNFNSLWEINTNSEFFEIKDHSIYNDYANQWNFSIKNNLEIEKPIKIDLVLKLQKYYYYSMIISLIVLLGLIFIFFKNNYLNRKKR